MSDLWWFDSCLDGHKIIDLIGVYFGLQNFTRKYHFIILDYLLYGVIQVSEWNFD